MLMHCRSYPYFYWIVGLFGKNTHIRRIGNSVTFLPNFQNAAHLQNTYPNAGKLLTNSVPSKGAKIIKNKFYTYKIFNCEINICVKVILHRPLANVEMLPYEIVKNNKILECIYSYCVRIYFSIVHVEKECPSD